jgi:hypothetical protein
MTDGPSPGRFKRRSSQRKRRDVFPTFEEIAELTYELFLANGRHVERVFDYWQQAEDELLKRAASRATR